MSMLNLGLQSVGLPRHAGESRFEAEASNCNSLSALRRTAVKCPDFCELQAEELDALWNALGVVITNVPFVRSLTCRFLDHSTRLLL